MKFLYLFLAFSIFTSHAQASFWIPNGSITTLKIAPALISNSTNVSNVAITSSSPTDVAGLSLTITTHGRPVLIFFEYVGGLGTSQIYCTSSSGAGALGYLTLVKTTLGVPTTVSALQIGGLFAGSTSGTSYTPITALTFVQVPDAGVHTYKIQAQVVGPTTSCNFANLRIRAFEF